MSPASAFGSIERVFQLGSGRPRNRLPVAMLRLRNALIAIVSCGAALRDRLFGLTVLIVPFLPRGRGVLRRHPIGEFPILAWTRDLGRLKIFWRLDFIARCLHKFVFFSALGDSHRPM